ncbi:MAG TPA: type VI secretion system-associated FHA domain protein TagH [Paracoccaceae bacterium]|nr:type VI secretion system-associated FHA domain protein TagH [Paracoccaceae bacterium]
MSLLLRIDNLDSLPDGGPVSYEVNRRGLDIGRDSYLDWTLPDPERFISGKHCEIRYRDGGYWLHDVSTNGTTLNGRGGRLTEPYRLQDGDRIHIGQYIVAVELTAGDDDDVAPEAAPVGSSGAVSSDPWGGVDGVAEAVDRRDFAAHARAEVSRDVPRGPTDLSEENISWGVGRITEGAAPTEADIWGAPPSGGAGAAADGWGWTPPPASGEAAPARSAPSPAPENRPAPAHSAVEPPQEATARAPESDVHAPQVDPFSAPAAEPASGLVSSAAPVAAPAADLAPPPGRPAPQADPFPGPAADPASESAPPASGLASRWAGGAETAEPVSSPAGQTPADQPPASRAGAQAAGFVAAFERGAGMPAGSVAARGDEAFAEDLGALENNPLKFSPTPEDALRIMFGARSSSYLDATRTVESSFRDLQKHQLQTFAAMQQALQALIEDLDPKSIEGATAKDGGLAGMVGSRRARFWDTYVERFRAKSGRHERGMIDAFMVLFAEMYDRQR